MPLNTRCLAWTITTLLLLSAALGCITIEDREGITVVVTLGPQREMVEAVGMDLVNVVVMVPKGASPHTYTPLPDQMKDVARARAYFKVGTGLEFEINYLATLRAQNKEMVMIDTSEGVEIFGDHCHLHHCGDPHVWSDPLNAVIMVENIYKGLASIDEKNQRAYKDNMDAYILDLEALDDELSQDLAKQDGKIFLTYHGGWGYLAHRYDLEQITVEDRGKKPGPEGIADIVRSAQDLGIDVLYIDPSFDTTKAETIAYELGGKVITLDPLAQDYIDNMRRSVQYLLEGLVKE